MRKEAQLQQHKTHLHIPFRIGAERKTGRQGVYGATHVPAGVLR